MAIVTFRKGLHDDYVAITNKDTDCLYFITDTQQLFLGETEFTRPVLSGSGAPSAVPSGPKNIFYFDTTNQDLYVSINGGPWQKASDKTAIDALDDRLDTIEGKPAYNITSTQVTNWDNEVGAKEIAQAAVVANTAITGATHTKITYDSKGLVTSGSDLTATDIPTVTMSKISDAGALATKDEVAESDLASALTTKINGKQDALVFNTAYDATNNKAATMADIEDAVEGLSGAMHFRGVVNADPTITPPSLDPAAESGDVVIYGNKEFVYDGTSWHELGDETIYAVKGEITNSDIAANAAIAQSKIANLTTDLSGKVDKETGKSLVSDTEISKLAGVSEGANKVEASTNNGYIKIDGTNTKVYEAPVGTVVDDNYSHITVTSTSVSDGTNTFNKYTPTDGSAAIASKTGSVVTIKAGVAQSNGAIANTDGADISLAAVASTGAASDITTDTTHQFVTNTEKTTWSDKQDALVFNTAYDASTNKVATMSDVTAAALEWRSFTS